MSNAKKERVMTPKGFLHKATTKAANNATAFIAAHRAWLETGELSDLTSPILRKLDDKAVMPTPALEEIKNAVLFHFLAQETKKAEDAMAKANEPKAQKAYVAAIYDAKGNIVTYINDDGEEKEMIQSFDMSQDGERWCDRRLFDGAPDWHGEVVSTKGLPPIHVLREDSIARILKKPKGPAVHTKGVSTKKLGFGVKAKGDHFHFSKG